MSESHPPDRTDQSQPQRPPARPFRPRSLTGAYAAHPADPTQPLDLPRVAPAQAQSGPRPPTGVFRPTNGRLREQSASVPPSPVVGQPAVPPASPSLDQQQAPRPRESVAPASRDDAGTSTSVRRRSRLRGWIQGIVALILVVALALGAFAGVRYQDSIRDAVTALDWQLDWHSVEETTRSVSRRALDVINEKPTFADVPGPETYPICEGTTPSDIDLLMPAMDMMRRTDEGLRLFRLLVDNGVCVGVEDIPYNSGYTYAAQSGLTGSWSRSYIMVDTDVLHAGETDVTAALLVHESTHLDRYIRGLACRYSNSCTYLDNGVELDEEIAAHAAEAEWWIAAYGTDGKRFAIGYDYGLNQLVEAYLEGPDAFSEYVRSQRSDPREGSW